VTLGFPMWTILSTIAIVSLFVSFFRGPNAIWGGATGGLIVGIIAALMRGGFTFSIIWKGIAIGVLLGVIAEIMSMLARRISRS